MGFAVSVHRMVRSPATIRRKSPGDEAMQAIVYDYFARKVKIIVLTLLTYAALC